MPSYPSIRSEFIHTFLLVWGRDKGAAVADLLFLCYMQLYFRLFYQIVYIMVAAACYDSSRPHL